MQNYHRHSSYSNIFTADSSAVNEDYAKRAVELGHKILSSVEHGFQGYYYETFELAQKYGLKFIFGAEAYWVKDRFEKDRSNNHIILLAKNENGRKAINYILSEANISGYYFKPRVDLELLLSLPKDDVFITSACIAFWKYEDSEQIVEKLHNHFGDNFMLEIQYHNVDIQKQINENILNLSSKYGIEMIVGLDSHYIYPEEEKERDYLLKSKNIFYEDEDGFYLDYPSDEEVKNRFIKQGIFTESQIQKAMDNTDKLLDFEDIVFTKDIKLVSLYPNKTQEEKNHIYNKLISKKFKEYVKDAPKDMYDTYFEGVKKEVQTYIDTGMVDYPLFDYQMVKRGVEKGGVITSTGRGSGASFFTNTLCGFSKVDRFTAPIKLYPERFMSKTRILETHSLPDLDMNVSQQEIFAEAQKEILDEYSLNKDEWHSCPMIAYGTFKKKSAFKLYARANDLDFEIANEISQEIEKYDVALKYADDDEKDDINIYDYVDEKYHNLIRESQKYWGIISDKKKHACGYLLYDKGDIRKDIGVIKCKSDSTKKEYITTVIDGAIAENYKFLKNDILKVDTVLLTDLVFKRIGIKPFTVNELSKLVLNNKKIWDIYSNGYTIGVNQVEKDATKKKVMKYKPQNISELSAFIAAIRPSFKSMYSKFESRQPFEYGIKAIDDIIKTPQFPYSFILYQEQTMNILNYSGFPLDECYGIIKSIAKKHPEKVRPLKGRFIEGFEKKLIEKEKMSIDFAKETSAKVWQIISDSCGYGFNSSHAYCMALDSLYNAYQKAYYPYEFYEVLLQTFSEKGKKDKVSILKQEMKQAFGIEEGEYKFGLDNRKFTADKDNGVIYPSLLSIKGLSQSCANDLYKLGKEKYDNFYELYKALLKTQSINRSKINTLIEIDYFSDFGSEEKLKTFIEQFDKIGEKKQIKKSSISSYEYKEIVKKHCARETEKVYMEFNSDEALLEIWNSIQDTQTSMLEKIKHEIQHLGFLKTILPDISHEYAVCLNYECKFKHPKIQICRLYNGEIETVKVKIDKFEINPFSVGDVIKTKECSKEGKWISNGTDENGKPKFIRDMENKEVILKTWSVVKKKC